MRFKGFELNQQLVVLKRTALFVICLTSCFWKFTKKDFQVVTVIHNSCYISDSAIVFQREISGWLRSETRVTARMLQRIRDRVQKWYHDEGYACAQVVNFGNLNTNEVVCEVVEGDITQVQIQFQDKLGFPAIGFTQKKIIQRELPDQVSMYPCSIACNTTNHNHS